MGESNTFVLGVDLGQAADYTALAIVERKPPLPDRLSEPDANGRREPLPADPARYTLGHIERATLGLPYPDVVETVIETLQRPELKDVPTVLALDGTGVGRPVVDMFRQAGLAPLEIVITGGYNVTVDGPAYHVPKRDLAGVLQALLQTDRLKVAAATPDCENLKSELLNFRVKVTANANDTYEAWREGDHDDLVLATAIACWVGERCAKRGAPPRARVTIR